MCRRLGPFAVKPASGHQFIFDDLIPDPEHKSSKTSYYATAVKLHTPAEVGRQLGSRVRELRLARNWRRATLAERAGVGLSTLARFETSGRITLGSLLAIADALGRLDELAQMFAPPPARSLAELERARDPKRPQRGRR